MLRNGSMVSFYPATGRIAPLAMENPVPERAWEEQPLGKRVGVGGVQKAMYASGVGPVSWAAVKRVSDKQIAEFEDHFQILQVFAENEKTSKPRPTGRPGKIMGLALAPHFYPNFLNMMRVDSAGQLKSVPKEEFNAFNGTTVETAWEQVRDGVEHTIPEAKNMLDFCKGSSEFCRATCLVLTGNNPSSQEATFSKMKLTYALLSDPVKFVAMLHKHLQDFAIKAKRDRYDAVVRLNMLSDIPWYAVTPELFEAHGPNGPGGRVEFYDYTKVPFWNSEEYHRVADLLDLTFSFSGTPGNAKLCEQALQRGFRVAAAFASATKERSASPSRRTSFQEILHSGLVIDGRIRLFGGNYPIIDGDVSDFRKDDPLQSIIALNFKDPNVGEMKVPHMQEWLPKSRAKFTVKVPETERAEAYLDARNKMVKYPAQSWLWELVFGEKKAAQTVAYIEPSDLIHLSRIFEEEMSKPRPKLKEAIKVVKTEAKPIVEASRNQFPGKAPTTSRSKAYLSARNRIVKYVEQKSLWSMVFGDEKKPAMLSIIAPNDLIYLAQRFDEEMTSTGGQLQSALDAVADEAQAIVSRYKANGYVSLRRNAYDDEALVEAPTVRVEDPNTFVTEETSMPMQFIGDSGILIGPHVPTVLRD